MCDYIYQFRTDDFPWLCKDFKGQDWGFAQNRNNWRLREEHFTAQEQCFLTLIHVSVSMSRDIFFSNQVCFGLLPFFTFLARLECSYVILRMTYANSKRTPNDFRRMVIMLYSNVVVFCSMGPAGFYSWFKRFLKLPMARYLSFVLAFSPQVGSSSLVKSRGGK